MSVYPSTLQPGPLPQGSSTVCASMCTPTCVHTMQVCHSVHVSPCAPMCAHMHVCGGLSRAVSSQGPRVTISRCPCESSSSAPGLGHAHQLCVCPGVHVCHCRGLWGWVGPMFLHGCLSPSPSIGELGAGRAAAGSCPTPAIVCLPSWAYLPPSLPASKP